MVPKLKDFAIPLAEFFSFFAWKVACANKDLRLFQQSSGDFRSVTRD